MAQDLRIKRVIFRASGGSDGEPLNIETPNVTVLVGPNNSGKSLSLREIEALCQGNSDKCLLIKKIDLVLPQSFDELMAMLARHIADPPENHRARPDFFWLARPAIRQGEERIYEEVHHDGLRDAYVRGDSQDIRHAFVRAFTLRLDGRTRFDLVDPKETGPLEQYPQNHLWALFKDDANRQKVQDFTQAAFGKYFVVDPTGMRYFRARLSDRKPKSGAEEQALDARARTFHQKAPLVAELGDGVRCSVGLVSAIMSLDQRILLIDEPEAFLHPTLSRHVGRVLAQAARDRDATLITATHSSDFLFGCIQAAPDLRIVRLTYDGGRATARTIDSAQILRLMNDPLLRSTSALRALFYRGVVVTEADPDRALYDEINHRLLLEKEGIEDGIFINAQNWQTIPRLVAPLREIGIPAAAIFDFDVLMSNQFSHLWPLAYESEQVLQQLQADREKVRRLMAVVSKTACKDNGINAFEERDREFVKAFVDRMAQYGLFFVIVGELECWLSHLGVRKRRNKPTWLTDVFEKLGSDPSDNGYVRPLGGDVWDFVRQIEHWIGDQDRRGMPA
ncbi:MAG: AAA family ATPase [Bryobacterales bacterium]|nr:AAA family ATPase [Bryobacterales bacterium]